MPDPIISAITAAVAGKAADLARALERLAAADGDFASRLRELWPRAAAELNVSQGGVVNSATGSVGGHLMQARDVQVEGGLRVGDIQRPADRQ